MDPINVSTRMPEPIEDPVELQKAVASGTVSFPARARLRVKDPVTGEWGTIPSADARRAAQEGYEFETERSRILDEVKKQYEGIGGTVRVGIDSFVNQALLGVPDLYRDKTEDALELAKREAARKTQLAAHQIGSAAGFLYSLAPPVRLAGLIGRGVATALNPAAALLNVGTKAANAANTALKAQIGARIGEKAAEGTISKVAQSVVQGVSEGAALSLPHAVTEAALGDPKAGAEALLMGGALGGVLNPALMLAGRAVAKAATKTGEAASSMTGMTTPKDIARRLGRIFTGMDEDTLEYYATNVDRVNRAPTVAALKDEIDDAVGMVKTKVEAADDSFKAARDELAAAWNIAKADARETRIPLDIADELLAKIDDQKSVLGALSDEADDILAKSAVSFQKNDLLKLVDNLGQSVGAGKSKALIGDEALAAVTKLKSLRDRIEVGLPNTIDGVTLRDVLRQVRSDINYNQAAGEFNDTLNKLRKEFTSKVSNALKNQVPDYAKKMNEMAPLADALADMSKAFGTPDKAVSSLNRIIGGKAEVRDELLKRFGSLTNTDFETKLADFKAKKALLDRAKRGEDAVKEELFPSLVAKVRQAEQDLLAAKAAYEPVQRLTRESTENAILKMGYSREGIENVRALEAVGKILNRDILTDLRDRAVLDALDKATVQGSRRVNLFGALGAGAAGAAGAGGVGAGAGALLGGTFDMYGGRIVKYLIDNSNNVRGILKTEQALKKAATQLDNTPSVLKRMMEGAKRRAVPYTGNVLYRFYEGTGEERRSLKDRKEDLRKFQEKTSELVSNPSMMTDRLSMLAEEISEGGAPQVADLLRDKAALAINYLHREIPKPPKPDNMFAKAVKWEPSDYDLAKFEAKVAVVENPFIVLDELENGTLTKSHVDALKAVYPEMANLIVSRIMKTAMNGSVELPYADRLKLGLLIGENLDDTTTASGIQYYQETYTIPETQASPEGSGGTVKASVDLAGQLATSDQARSYKETMQ